LVPSPPKHTVHPSSRPTC